MAKTKNKTTTQLFFLSPREGEVHSISRMAVAVAHTFSVDVILLDARVLIDGEIVVVEIMIAVPTLPGLK